jgi:hypothetical protein
MQICSLAMVMVMRQEGILYIRENHNNNNDNNNRILYLFKCLLRSPKA